jgi:hypothetical protein
MTIRGGRATARGSRHMLLESLGGWKTLPLTPQLPGPSPAPTLAPPPLGSGRAHAPPRPPGGQGVSAGRANRSTACRPGGTAPLARRASSRHTALPLALCSHGFPRAGRPCTPWHGVCSLVRVYGHSAALPRASPRRLSPSRQRGSSWEQQASSVWHG